MNTLVAPFVSTTLELRGLRLRAGGCADGRLLFADLDAVVRPGERWSVIGPNGSGKSSLLAAMAGVFAVASGEVRLDDRPLEAWSAPDLAARRAWSPSSWLDPFPATVAATAALALGRGHGAWTAFVPRHDAAVDALLERVDLAALADADVATLSAGERQRLAVATALGQRAPLLLLDEPASHLDPAHRRRLVAILDAHARAGGSVVTTVHDLSLAWAGCSHAIVLDGRGGAVAGRRDDVLTAARLSAVFDTAIHALDVAGARHFVLADGA